MGNDGIGDDGSADDDGDGTWVELVALIVAELIISFLVMFFGRAENGKISAIEGFNCSDTTVDDFRDVFANSGSADCSTKVSFWGLATCTAGFARQDLAFSSSAPLKCWAAASDSILHKSAW